MAGRPATATAPAIDWKQVNHEILSRLNLLHEFRELGVRIDGDKPSGQGFVSCFSVSRDEREASAAVNVAGPPGLLGLYMDSGAGASGIAKASFFEFAARAPNPPPAVTNWQQARDYYASYVGITLPKTSGKQRRVARQQSQGTRKPPAANGTDGTKAPPAPAGDKTPDLMLRLESMPWVPTLADAFCRLPSKQGITREALEASGARLARRFRVPVMLIPCYRIDADFLANDPANPGQLLEPTATGCALWAQSGGKLQRKRKGEKPTEHKILQHGGGWFGLDGLRRLSRWRAAKPAGEGVHPGGDIQGIKTLWIVEGPGDMLALLGVIPPDQRRHHAVISNSSGARQSIDRRLLDMLPKAADALHSAGWRLRVCVLKDRDDAGEAGALTWSRTLATALGGNRLAVGHAVVAPVLPYPLVEKSGKDTRDFVCEGHGLADFERLTNEAEPVAAGMAVELDETSPPPARKESQTPSLTAGQPNDSGNPPLPPFSNLAIDPDDDDAPPEPRPVSAIVADFLERTGNWPRRVGETLFVHDEANPRSRILWFTGRNAQSKLFAWAGSRLGVVRWAKGVGCVEKSEFFAALQQAATAYEAAESLPHEPPLPNHYYACPMPQAEADDSDSQPVNAAEFAEDSPEQFCAVLGEHFSELVARFQGATSLDQWLIAAFFATPFWGGPPGTRPAFLIAADEGRGSGKSKLTEMLSRLLGGILDCSSTESWDSVRKRIMAPTSKHIRLARIDNLKSEKFSWAELESIITSHTLSGDAKYEHNASEPNRLTWVLTVNGPALSTDMAQRVVTVKLKRPEYDPTWEGKTLTLIESRRTEIIADIVRFLRRPAAPLMRHGRWAHWEDSILGRMPSGSDLAAYVKIESEKANAEQEDFELLESYFAKKLRSFEYDPDEDQIQIPSQVVANWYRETYHCQKADVRWISRMLNQAINEGSVNNLKLSRTNSIRVFWWVGKKHGQKFTDLENRLEASKRW